MNEEILRKICDFSAINGGAELLDLVCPDWGNDPESDSMPWKDYFFMKIKNVLQKPEKSLE